MNVIFALDTSRSIGWANYELATSFVQSIATNLEPSSQVGLVTFSDQARLVLSPTNVVNVNLPDLLTSVYDGVASTNTADALMLACSTLAASGTPTGAFRYVAYLWTPREAVLC